MTPPSGFTAPAAPTTEEHDAAERREREGVARTITRSVAPTSAAARDLIDGEACVRKAPAVSDHATVGRLRFCAEILVARDAAAKLPSIDVR